MRQIFWGIIGGMAGFSFGFVVTLAIIRDPWQLEKIVSTSVTYSLDLFLGLSTESQRSRAGRPPSRFFLTFQAPVSPPTSAGLMECSSGSVYANLTGSTFQFRVKQDRSSSCRLCLPQLTLATTKRSCGPRNGLGGNWSWRQTPRGLQQARGLARVPYQSSRVTRPARRMESMGRVAPAQ